MIYRRKLLIEKCKNGKISKENRFFSLINDLKMRKIENGFCLLNKNNMIFFQQDSKNETFWCDYYNIWSIFETEYSMNYQQIQRFIKNKMERHYKIEVLTPKEEKY